MTLIQGINVGAPVVPYDSADNQASHRATYGEGGLRTVTNNTNRNAIYGNRSETGMMVYVSDDDKYYKLKSGYTPGGLVDADWEELTFGGTSYWQRTGTNLSPLNLGDDVGIGTATPGEKLQIYGDKAGMLVCGIENPSSDAGVVVGSLYKLTNDDSFWAGIMLLNSGSTIGSGAFANSFAVYNQGYADTVFAVDGNKDFVFYSDPSDSHDFSSLANEIARLKASGKFGLSVAIPKAGLHVADGATSNITEGLLGEMAISSATMPRIWFEDTGEGAGDKVMAISYFNERIEISSLNDVGDTYDKQGILVIDRDNKVGIGETFPEYQLNLASATADNAIISLDQYNDDSNRPPYIYLRKSHVDNIEGLVSTIDEEMLGGIYAMGVNSSNARDLQGSAGILFRQVGAAGTYVGGEVIFKTKESTDMVLRNRVVISDTGLVGINTLTPDYALSVVGDDATTSSIELQRYSNNVGGSAFRFRKFRGTIGSPAQVQDDDLAGTLNFAGYIDGDMRDLAYFHALVDGTPSATSYPSRFEWWTTTENSVSPDKKMVLTNAGQLGLGTATPVADSEVNGSIGYKVTTVSATTYIILVTDNTIEVDRTATDSVILYLPSAALCYNATDGIGIRFLIKDTGCNAALKNITIQRNGSDTIINTALAQTSHLVSTDGASVWAQAISATEWIIC